MVTVNEKHQQARQDNPALALPRDIKKVQEEALAHATRLVVSDKVKAAALSGDDLARIAVAFPPWKPGGAFKLGELRYWDHTVIEALQDHVNSDPNHTPDTTPALWKVCTLAPEPGEYPLWVQPLSTNPYNATWDDGSSPVVVRHPEGGDLWENTHGDGNVWEPGAVGHTIWAPYTP